MTFPASPSMRNVMTSYPIDDDSDMPELPDGYWWALGNCRILGTKQLELRRGHYKTKRRLFREPITRYYYKVVGYWPAENPSAYRTPKENLQYFAYLILTYRPEAMYIKFEAAMAPDASKEY